MTEEDNSIDNDELRPEYDLSKLKFVGRGIYAERFRRGTKVAQLDDGAEESGNENAESVQYDSPG